MILTNRLDLPTSIVNAVRNDPYDRGTAHISVTGLISPARKVELEYRHRDEISEDVSDRIWALFGSIGHGILERAGDDALTEERLFITRHGWTISGKFDRFMIAQGLLSDYKITSTYAVKDGAKLEFEQQLNVYALMLREHGFDVRALEVVALLRDWRKVMTRNSPDYPQSQVLRVPVPLWEPARAEAYITERLLAHGQAQTVLPECTAEERWEKPGYWSLLREGNERATSRHMTADEAEAALRTATEANEAKKKPGAGYYLKKHPEIQTRCQDYCIAAAYCSQWSSLNPRPLPL